MVVAVGVGVGVGVRIMESRSFLRMAGEVDDVTQRPRTSIVVWNEVFCHRVDLVGDRVGLSISLPRRLSFVLKPLICREQCRKIKQSKRRITISVRCVQTYRAFLRAQYAPP
jgi:hypothetical protein